MKRLCNSIPHVHRKGQMTWLVGLHMDSDGHPEMHQWDIKYNDIIHGIDRTYAEGTLTHLSVSFSGLKFEIQTLATRQ